MGSVTITAPGSGAITVGGSGPFDPPAGTVSLKIECWGAGGCPIPSTSQEGGGGSGAYARVNAFPVVDGMSLKWNVPAGQLADGTYFGPASVLLPDLTAICISESARRADAGVIAVGDVHFSGAVGTFAQGGGGARGGSGGSSSAGPAGAGHSGSAGSHAAGGAGAAGGADVGAGGSGGGAGAPGSDGAQPGGGAGGGGSGANSGRGGAGQIRITW